MTKKSSNEHLSEREKAFIEQLRRHPELSSRFESILALASAQDGPLKTVDQLEDSLVQEVRKLGQEAMSQWALSAEERVHKELAAERGDLKSRKKKR